MKIRSGSGGSAFRVAAKQLKSMKTAFLLILNRGRYATVVLNRDMLLGFVVRNIGRSVFFRDELFYINGVALYIL